MQNSHDLSPLLAQLHTLVQSHAAQANDTTSPDYTVSHDEANNAFHWYRLALPEDIVDAAQLLFDQHARLAMVTAYNREHLQDPVHEVCYQFELHGVMINITVLLDAEHHTVPSITPIFANADWHEREMMELYGIDVLNQPNPQRLFLSEELDSGIMGEAVPLSIMMNGACTIDLWERILKDRANEEDISSSVTPNQPREE